MTNDRRRYRTVMEKMLQVIDSGEYPVGGRLPSERELAERFSVSRPTIREAIIALEALQRVQVKTGSGIYVLDSTNNANGNLASISAYELTEARALIEGEAAALAATMITEEEIAELEIALNEMADESADGTLVSELADKKFHHIIAKATRNKMISKVVDELWFVRDNNLSVHQAYQAICETDGQIRLNEHKEIFLALKNRDGASSRKAMHEHFSRLLNKLFAADEAEQMKKIKQSTIERRQRFSLNHLSGQLLEKAP